MSLYRLFEPNDKLTSTCVEAPGSLEHLSDLAEQVMYEVKKNTKNDARFFTWGNGTIAPMPENDHYLNT